MNSFHFDLRSISVTAIDKNRGFATESLNDYYFTFFGMNINDHLGTTATFTKNIIRKQLHILVENIHSTKKLYFK